MNKNSWVCEFFYYFTTIFFHKIIIYFNFLLFPRRESQTRGSLETRTNSNWMRKNYFPIKENFFFDSSCWENLTKERKIENFREREEKIFREWKARGWGKTTQRFFKAMDTHGHNKKDENFNHFTEMWLSLLMLLNWKLLRIK